MAGSAAKKIATRNSKVKRLGLKEKLGQPEFVLGQISQSIKDGDFASVTDFISAYIANSPRYKSQDKFAQAIGTTRQTLHRLFAHGNVSLNVLFDALERIHADQG